MDFISVQDAAKNWGISERRIQKLCEENRIEGAVKFSRLWLIPRNAQKPSDRRRKELPKIENIIESYGQYVYNLALKLSANPEYADDLTQETFIKAWLHIKELRSPEAIKKWLRIICINEFRMSLRKQQRENNVEYFESIEELERDKHIFPLLSAVCRLCTGRRTIGLPSIRSHGSAAYLASLEIRPWPFCQQRSLQRRIKGQNSLAEVAAISPRPAFPKHIALAIQRQAAAVPVIVGTPF